VVPVLLVDVVADQAPGIPAPAPAPGMLFISSEKSETWSAGGAVMSTGLP
jgi:hypothetical protein